jgi:hypothetical protein
MLSHAEIFNDDISGWDVSNIISMIGIVLWSNLI